MDHKTTIHAEMVRETDATDRMPMESPQQPKKLTGHIPLTLILAACVLLAVALFVRYGFE